VDKADKNVVKKKCPKIVKLLTDSYGVSIVERKIQNVMKIQENKRITRQGAQVDDFDNQEIEEMINKRNYPSPTTSKPASKLTSKKAKTLKSSPK